MSQIQSMVGCVAAPRFAKTGGKKTQLDLNGKGNDTRLCWILCFFEETLET